jgi:hypothetical protein
MNWDPNVAEKIPLNHKDNHDPQPTEDPLVADWFGFEWRVHQLPCPILDESIILLLHGFFPLIMSITLFKGSRFKFNR